MNSNEEIVAELGSRKTLTMVEALQLVMAEREIARALVRALVAAWDHDRGAHALRCGGTLVDVVGRCREAMEEWR